ncbi:TPA: hypothetical protein DEP96_04265 [Candidatus Uhrbacteria bacterium]|nr:hypothetical protein [Candidatus Uhrbacteria bacterium]
MPRITAVIEKKHILPYLEARGLKDQYIKAKNYLLAGDTKSVFFKELEPQHSNTWYFRINKQFRAICFFDGNDLIVAKIDNHQ